MGFCDKDENQNQKNRQFIVFVKIICFFHKIHVAETLPIGSFFACTYYMGIPVDMQEAAEIDGANEMVYFFKILLPLCTPIIATIAMWQFVGMWNSYFDAMIYLNDASKQPLQLVLRSILIQNQPEPGMVSDMQSTAARAQLAELLKYAKQGVIINLEDYIDAYMPNLTAVFEQAPEYRQMCTDDQGHIWALPWIEQLGYEWIHRC